jgi:hypothetical protein
MVPTKTAEQSCKHPHQGSSQGKVLKGAWRGLQDDFRKNFALRGVLKERKATF